VINVVAEEDIRGERLDGPAGDNDYDGKTQSNGAEHDEVGPARLLSAALALGKILGKKDGRSQRTAV